MSGRKNRGMLIAEKNDQIKRLGSDRYLVNSQSTNKQYNVLSIESGWVCECPDHRFRNAICKHIHAVEISLSIRNEVKEHVIESVNIQSCQFCLSTNFVKWGVRKNKNYSIQIYKCKDCTRRFSMNLGFEKMGASPEIITSAMQLYFSGESLRNVQKFLELQGVKITHKTVWNWIRKYVKLMEQYLDEIKPQVSDKWRTDELYLKIKGNRKYLYALMDDDTRFWIARQVSNHKYTEDVRPMFRHARKTTGKKPKVLISDGAYNFHQAFKKEFYTWQKPRTQHIRHIHLKHDHNNNKMERLNGEIRDREKVMRGIKKDDSPIIIGMQIFHNFIRSHMALDNQTPADMAGIRINGNNKWITLIQNATTRR